MLMDPVRIARAVATNVLALLFPRYYLKITEQTGRGSGDTDPFQVAEYYYECFVDYIEQISSSLDQVAELLKGKTLLEYGPGDTPGVALLFYAYGADAVILVDRFPMLKLDAGNLTIIAALIEKLPAPEKDRALGAFNRKGDLDSGFREEVLSYRTHAKGLSCLNGVIDMIYSRAVLEHVADLDASFSDMFRALRPGGLAIHQVDLKSHGLHKVNPLDFLIWPSWLWCLMYSGKGVPNRWRFNKYREVVAKTGLITTSIHFTSIASKQDVDDVREKLPAVFNDVSDEDLKCLGFWMYLHKPLSDHK